MFLIKSKIVRFPFVFRYNQFRGLPYSDSLFGRDPKSETIGIFITSKNQKKKTKIISYTIFIISYWSGFSFDCHRVISKGIFTVLSYSENQVLKTFRFGVVKYLLVLDKVCKTILLNCKLILFSNVFFLTMRS